MSTDTHTKIREEVERRLAIARAAAEGARSPWSGDYEGIRDADGQAVFVGPWGYLNDEALAHALLHDPADAIRRYEYALKVLDRHTWIEQRNWSRDRGDFVEPACVHCQLTSNDSEPLFRDWPCPELVDLAESLGIDTGGQP